MNARLIIRLVIVPLFVIGAAFAAAAARAQDSAPVSSVTFSEVQLNAILLELNTNPNAALTVDLQQGQMVLILNGVDRNRNAYTITLTLVPAVANGQLELNPTQLTLNDLTLDIDNPAAADTIGDVDSFFSEQVGGGAVQSMIITDSELTLFWINADPDAPALVLRDNLLSLTYTEASLNQLPSVTTPTDPLTSAVTIDLRPGQAVIDVMRTAEPTNVVFIISPAVANNRVTWQIESQANSSTSTASAFLAVWRGYVESTYSNSSMVNAIITDNAITFTWDITAQTSETGEVVYTFNESEVNAALAVVVAAPTDTFTVDMQPNQVVLNVTTVDETGAPLVASLTLMPVLNGGVLNWAATSLTVNGVTVNASDFAVTDTISSDVTSGFSGGSSDTRVTAVEITDTSMSITVVAG